MVVVVRERERERSGAATTGAEICCLLTTLCFLCSLRLGLRTPQALFLRHALIKLPLRYLAGVLQHLNLLSLRCSTTLRLRGLVLLPLQHMCLELFHS